MVEKKGSLKPSQAIEGGGLIGDVNVTFKDTHFGYFTYPGRNVEASVLMTTVVEEDETETEVNWTMGQAIPSKDGKCFVGDLRKSTNLYTFLKSLVDAGFPEEKLSNDITILDGMKAHIVQQVIKRAGEVGKRQPRADGRVFEPTVIVVTEILHLPWEKSDKKGNSPIEERATAAVMEVLADNPKGLDKKKLASLVFAATKEDADRNALIQLVYQEDFLKKGPWEFDGKTVKAA